MPSSPLEATTVATFGLVARPSLSSGECQGLRRAAVQAASAETRPRLLAMIVTSGWEFRRA
jgi:hypothetical protein